MEVSCNCRRIPPMPTATVDLLVPGRHRWPWSTPKWRALSRDGCRFGWGHNRVVAGNRIGQRLRPASIFRPPATRRGVLVTPVPHPGRLIDGYRAALDDAARDGPVVVGGVSLGAAVAAAWALEHPDRAVAVLAALPAWTGEPELAPAAQAARYTAARLRCDGLAATTTRMRASSPVWLAEELTRSWRVQWPELPDAMEEAAAYVAPSRAELARLVAPLAVAAASMIRSTRCRSLPTGCP